LTVSNIINDLDKIITKHEENIDSNTRDDFEVIKELRNKIKEFINEIKILRELKQIKQNYNVDDRDKLINYRFQLNEIDDNLGLKETKKILKIT
jgi:hypothetical protein